MYPSRAHTTHLLRLKLPVDEKLAREETNYDPAIMMASNTARKMRWEHVGG